MHARPGAGDRIGLVWRRNDPRKAALLTLCDVIRERLPPEVDMLGERAPEADRGDSRAPPPRKMAALAVSGL